MHNNEILSRLVDALTLKDDSLAEIFALGGEEMTGADALARTRENLPDGRGPARYRLDGNRLDVAHTRTHFPSRSARFPTAGRGGARTGTCAQGWRLTHETICGLPPRNLHPRSVSA